jgi:hypothetical protein
MVVPKNKSAQIDHRYRVIFDTVPVVAASALSTALVIPLFAEARCVVRGSGYGFRVWVSAEVVCYARFDDTVIYQELFLPVDARKLKRIHLPAEGSKDAY